MNGNCVSRKTLLNEKIYMHVAAGNQSLIEEKVVNIITLDYQKEVD